MNRMEANTPLVSILIPVYNREPYIEACVRSAMQQTVREIEIVVVDNHSSDGTWAILERLAAEDSRIRIFRNESNLGAVPNWQRCMEEARSDIAKLLFSDDTIRADYIEKTLPWLEDDNVGFVFTAVRIGTDAQERDGGQLYYVSYERDGVYPTDEFIKGSLLPGDRFPVSPGCALMRLEDMKRNLRLSLPGSEITDFAAHGAGPDLLLYLLTAAQYGRCAYVCEPLCFFRIHKGSITINDPDRYIPRCHQAARDWFQKEIQGSVNADDATQSQQSHGAATQKVDNVFAALLEKGEACFLTGDVTGAEHAFLQALGMDTDNGDVNNDLGVLYHQRGDYPRALHHLIQALEADSNNHHAVINAVAVLVALQQQAEAINLLSAYLSNNADDQDARALRDELLAGQTAIISDPPGQDASDAHTSDILVSAIVSTYNSEVYLRGCLEDLLAQTLGKRLEIIVIDSGSEQNERAIVEEFRADNPDIRYVRTERETIYAAWNRGVRMARGRYITNANTDDRHRRDALERMAEYLQRDAGIALVYADSKVTRKENASFGDASAEACFRWPDFDPRHLFSVCYIGPQPMWRRSVHEKHGYFDAQMTVAGDYDFWLRMVSTETFQHVPEVLGLYLDSSSSIEHSFSDACASESEVARQRNWPAAWGDRPLLCDGYLVPVEDDVQYPRISIVMPTKDRLHLLGRALDSIIAQSYRNWELVLINDGGESVHTVVDGRDAEDRIRCIEFDQSRGQAAARNAALAETRGEIICYLDDDDIYLPDHLQTVVKEMVEEGNSFIYTDAVVVNETLSEGVVQEVGRSNPYAHGEYSHERLLVSNYIPINTWAHRRSCLDEVGVFDSALASHEDWEFLLRLAERYEFRHVGKTTVEVRQRADQIDSVTQKTLGEAGQAYRQIYARHERLLTKELRAERQAVLGQFVKSTDAACLGNHSLSGRGTDPDNKWRSQNVLENYDIALFESRMRTKWKKCPSVHFVLIDVHTDEQPVVDSIASIASQLYSGWGLSVISGRPAITAEFESEPNLEWIRTDCLETELEKLVGESSTDWIGFLFSGDQVDRHYLVSMLDLADVREGVEVVYSDTDSLNSAGEYFGVKFKPDADIDLLRSVDYIGNGCLLKTDTVKKNIGFVSPGHYSFVYGMLLKIIEDSGDSAFAHDTSILFHGYEENARLEELPTSISRRKDYLEQHLERCGLNSKVIEGYRPGVFYVEYQHATAPLVSIIIPTKDALEILEPCISTLLGRTGYKNFEVIVVDNNSSKPETLAYFEKIQRDDPRIRVVKYPKPYNYSAITNMAAELSNGDYLVLLNNDTEVIKEDWLDRMLSLGQRKDVGIVGVRLLHPDSTIQHAGVVVGMTGSADHPHIGAEAESPGYMGQNLTVRGVSAVTAACLLIEKDLYFSVGGLDEEDFSVLFNDVDLCLKVGKKGLRIVYTPYAVLMHHGSFSLKKKVNKPDEVARRHRECLTLVQKWLPVLANDPAYNRNLCLNSQDVLPDDRFVPGWDMHRHDCLRLVAFPADEWRDDRFSAKTLLSQLQEDNSLQCMYITADSVAGKRVLEPVELERRKPDVLLFHASMPDSCLMALEYYAAFNTSMFKVLVLDDRQCLPSRKRNNRGKPDNKKEQRVRKALASCDRLLVPTIQLADAWSGIIDDIRVVPGSIDMRRWADLPSQQRKQHLDTWLAALTPPEAISVENGLDTEESVGTDVRRSESDKQNQQAVYRRHGDNLLEELVRKYAMKLQSLENNAGDRQQAEQSLFDATINEGGDYAGEGGSTGIMANEQRLHYLREQFLRRVEKFDYVLPSIHLIMVADESNIVNIADTIDSLGQQIYAGWGLSVISTAPPPHGDFDDLPMLEWIQTDDVERSFIDTARKSACDWVASVMPGDTLEPEALSVFVDYINRNHDWKFIYSDEDCVDVSGNQISHKFKPDANPDYLCSSPYTGNLSLVHRDMLEQVSSDTGIPAASFFDLALKVLEQHGASAIGHVPALLYHQLQENEQREARDTWVKPVLEAYVRRNNIDADVLAGAAAGTCMIDYRCSGAPSVCIAIYVGSDLVKLERTVASLLSKTAYSNCTIRVGVDRAFALQLEKYQVEQLSVDLLDKNTNRCAYFDSLAQRIDADYMVFMDPGVVVLQDNWLERLLSQGQRAEIGVVGIRLLSPHKKIAHAGILTGIGSFAIGGCIGEGDTLEQEGYMQRSQVVQNLSAVSSACMLVKRSLYQSVQGFDAEIAVQLYRDVDFCLRVSKTGKRIVWTPFVTMLISDERLDTYTGDDGLSRVEKDARKLTSTWLQSLARDPAYNRNLTLARADFSREKDFRPMWDPSVPGLPRITGCGFGSYVAWAYRVAQPLDALSAAGRAIYSHVPFKGKSQDRMPSAVEMERMQPDVLLLQNSLHDNCLDSLRQYRKSSNMLMVLGQDDLMFAVPPKSSCFKAAYKDIKKRLRTCLSLVDRLVVTNEPLADELSGFISDIRIVPNHLDARIWGALESRRGCGVKPRVGWAGAMQHHGDLEILANAVRETADEVDWIFMGMCPEFLRPYVKEVHEYVAFSAYPAMLANLNLDLAVAPLERNRFNRCKSNLRLLEYGAMGWPVIATDIEPYRGAPVHLVGNQTQAWVNAIRDHIHDLDATWKAGDTLREWVRENHLLQHHLDDWLDALDSASGSRHRQSLMPDKASGL